MRLVTFKQAEMLKKLGFEELVTRYYDIEQELNHLTHFDNEYRVGIEDIENDCNSSSSKDSAPTVSEALDFIRDVKGIPCAVNLEYFDDLCYYGVYLMEFGKNNGTESFDTYPGAENALLDAVLEHLISKI